MTTRPSRPAACGAGSVRRLADRRPHRRDDDCFFHGCAVSEVGQQLFERFADLLGLAVEQMIRRVDDDELLRLLRAAP